MWLNIIDLINTRFIYYKGGFIIYRKMVMDGNILLLVRMLYIVSIGQNIISDEQYHLDSKLSLKAIISSYKEIIDSINITSKK